MLKKVLIGLAVAVGLAGCFFVYIAFIYKPDLTAATNSVILAEVALKNNQEARRVIDVEYKQKMDAPELWRFWTLYVESCEHGQCFEITTRVEKPGYGEKAAYAAVRQETEKLLKSPASAKFEDKGGLKRKGEAGELYSFSYYVDSQNTFGAMLRMNCNGVVQNVGEYTWYISTLECKE